MMTVFLKFKNSSYSNCVSCIVNILNNKMQLEELNSIKLVKMLLRI